MDSKQRTIQQNKAIRVFDKLLSDSLNLAGLEMKIVLKPSYKIWWTPESVHTNIWLPIQKFMFGTDSTTKLDKVGQIEKIHEMIMRELGEKHGVEFIPFPSIETENEELK